MQKAQEQNIFIHGTEEAEQTGRVPGRAPPSPAIPPKRAKVTAEQGGPEAPIFLQELKDTAVSIGHDFLLKVIVTGNPRPHLTWYKEKIPLASIKKKVKVEEEEEEEDYGSLQIFNSKVADAGVYSCVATNKHGEAVSTATVTVTDMEDLKILTQQKNYPTWNILHPRRYLNLQIEVERLWKKKSCVVPIVIGALGAIPKGLPRYLEILNLPDLNILTLQKTTLLGTAYILRRYLNSS